MKEFTVIYLKTWQTGSHHHSITKCARVVAESVEKVMEVYGDTAVYLFDGHPKMVGETGEESFLDVTLID